MISLIVVNFRSSALAEEAIRSARATSSETIQVVVVDNSCDEREAALLRAFADVLVVSEKNSGYAGGINQGRRVSDGDILIVANPDIRFHPGAIDRLAAELAHAAVAGPALYWDESLSWHLPPADPYTTRARVDAVMASRARSWQMERDRRRIRQRLRFWSSTETRAVDALSGAVLAIRSEAFDDVSGFDEKRFSLYFEETDFLRRVAERHGTVVYVPAASCQHLHNQSAVQVSADAAARYAESEFRFLEKWSGPFAARAIKRLERALPPHEASPLSSPLVIDSDELLVEASPLGSFETAAGLFPKKGEVVSIPENAWTAPAIFLRVIERATTRVVSTYVTVRT
jgi:GT2 family glycosyltransferase